MFQGNQVRDEYWDVALFQELGSAPATLEAGKACDAYGLLEDHEVQQADAEQAYIQSKLDSKVPTWVRMPPERRPKHGQNSKTLFVLSYWLCMVIPMRGVIGKNTEINI